MPEGKAVTAPSVLPEHAQEIWRSVFNSAWGETCKTKKSDDQREACSAANAWAAVKESYRKNSQGEWVERTFEECKIEIDGVPLPASLYESPVSAGMTWRNAYLERSATSDIADAATHAWAELRNQFERGEDGVWKRKNGILIEPASEEAVEVERAEPVISRSIGAGASFRMEGTPILTEEIQEEDFEAVIAKYGHELAACPEGFPWIDWIARPPRQRTVAAVIRMRLEQQAYDLAVERSKKMGWDTYENPNGSGEVVFRGWLNVGEKHQHLAHAVLVADKEAGTQEADWQLEVLSTIRSSTLAVRVAPGKKRFRGPKLQ